MIRDIEEAIEALSSSPIMRAAGIDESFAPMFARNMENFELLAPEVRNKIASQFGEMAYMLSTFQSASIHSDDHSKRLATWLKQLNLLLALSKVRQP